MDSNTVRGNYGLFRRHDATSLYDAKEGPAGVPARLQPLPPPKPKTAAPVKRTLAAPPVEHRDVAAQASLAVTLVKSTETKTTATHLLRESTSRSRSSSSSSSQPRKRKYTEEEEKYYNIKDDINALVKRVKYLEGTVHQLSNALNYYEMKSQQDVRRSWSSSSSSNAMVPSNGELSMSIGHYANNAAVYLDLLLSLCRAHDIYEVFIDLNAYGLSRRESQLMNDIFQEWKIAQPKCWLPKMVGLCNISWDPKDAMFKARSEYRFKIDCIDKAAEKARGRYFSEEQYCLGRLYGDKPLLPADFTELISHLRNYRCGSDSRKRHGFQALLLCQFDNHTNNPVCFNGFKYDYGRSTLVMDLFRFLSPSTVAGGRGGLAPLENIVYEYGQTGKIRLSR